MGFSATRLMLGAEKPPWERSSGDCSAGKGGILETKNPGTAIRRMTKMLNDPESPVAPVLRRITLIAGSISAGVGAIVLVGWVLQVTALQSVLPGLPSMKANTSLCLILIGLSLCVMRDRATRESDAARGLAIATLAIAGLTLAQSITGVHLGLDELLSRDTMTMPPRIPGRMSPFTAASFVLFASATLTRRRWLVASQVMALAALLTCSVVLTGYIYHADVIIKYISMAVHTATVFWLLSVGILCRDADRGVLTVFTSAGSAGIMTRRVLPVSIIVPLLFGWLNLLGQKAGWYEIEIGIALQTIALGAVFAVVIWLSGQAIGRTDAQVAAARVALQMAHDGLESRVRERTTELDVAKGRLQCVLDAATQVAITATDAVGLIRVFNSGAERMLGYRAEEMINVRTPEILHDPEECLERSRQLTKELGRPVEGFDVFVAYAREHTFEEREWTYVRKDGSRLDANLIVTAVRSPDGVIAGYLGIATDITERKRLETELRLNNKRLEEQTRRAEEANQAKSEFLATMSHEIRTPMNGVVGMADLLLHTDLSIEQRGYAEHVLSSADSLLTVINDILDFSKVESGKLDLEVTDFVFRTALEEAAELLAERAQTKGLEMACLVHHDIPAVVRGDSGRLRQIVTNLLGNAIKFTPSGEVVLRAKRASDSGDEMTIRVEVSDTGIGIPPEARGRLFQSFSQVDASTTRQFGGTGLGLAISKRLAGLMGGEIGLESKPGEGSTFWFTVRLGKAAVSRVQAPTPREDLRGLRALAVDDNRTNLQIVSAQTHAWGMECDVATHGSEALRMIAAAARRRPYDVAILDMHMPDMDGLELAEAIRRDRMNKEMKLILMTSMVERGAAARSGEAGVAACLTKPVRESRLHNCLRTVLGPPVQASQEAAQQTSRIALVHFSEDAKGPLRPRVLLAEDNETNQMAAVHMLEMLGYRVQVVVNGIEAVQACREGDYGIVLMDNQMPKMDGLTATREIRKFERDHGKLSVPIIALTANAMQGDREKCMAAGMNDYLSKPFKVVRLREILERWGRRSPSEILASESVAPVLHESAIDSSVFDQYGVAGRRTGEFVATLIDRYLAESTSRMSELNDAVEHRNAPALRLAAHSLKGSSSTVGAGRLAGLCDQLEKLARNTTCDGASALVAALVDELNRVRHALQVEREARNGVTGKRDPSGLRIRR